MPPGQPTSPLISQDAIRRMLMQGGDPSSMFSGDPSQQPAPSPPTPPASGTLAANMSPAAPPAPTTAPPSGTIASSFQVPEDKQQYLSEHPPAMPARPRGDFDKIPDGQPGADTWGNRHNVLRHVLASLFTGAAEFGGDLNHHPGAAGPFINRWAGQADAQRQYDQNQPAAQQKAGNEAYNQYLEQGKEASGIEKTQAEIPAIRQNVPMLKRQQEFIDKIRTLKESGKYGSDNDLFNAVLPEAATIPGMSRQQIVDAINNSKTLGSKYTLTRDPQTQAPIELVDRQGNHFSQSNLPQDPEAKQMWNDAQTAAGNKLTNEENKENRVAEHGAQAQARAFAQQDEQKGKADADSAMKDINAAKGQQELVEKLLSGKMSPSSQTAAVYKLVGLTQPTGAHRVMPAEVEGWKHVGGWSDRAAQWFANAKSGDQFPPELLPDIVSTARTITQNQVKTANDALESSARVHGYKVPGSNAAGRLDKPEDYQQPQQGGQGGGAQHTPGGQAQGLKEGATGTGTDGKKYIVKGGVWVSQ